jgi:DNA repair protein RecO (recombination protein O)
LVLRRTLVGDADLLVSLFTADKGLLTVSARGARRASSKLGALEPIHTLLVTFELRPGADVGKLVEARIERARLRATSDSARLDAAFRVLTWVRSVSSPLEPDPRMFATVETLLDRLDDEGTVRERRLLASTGLRVLEALGYGLELDACVSCGAPCPEGSAALLDPERGGLVCRACGGARLLLKATQRRALAALARGDVDVEMDEDAERAALDVVETALAAHAAPTSSRSRR